MKGMIHGMKTANTQNSYEDIIALPHHRSLHHPPMGMAERAAQFSPFAALTGYGDAVQETARQTTEKIELDEDAKEELNRIMQVLAAQLHSQGYSQKVRITYFRPDLRKAGGEYVTETGVVRKLPLNVREVVLERTMEGADGTRQGEDFQRKEGRLHEAGELAQRIHIPIEDILQMEMV